MVGTPTPPLMGTPTPPLKLYEVSGVPSDSPPAGALLTAFCMLVLQLQP